MSKVIECKGCIDCPFRYDDYNGDANGYDTMVMCVIKRHCIVVYDSWDRKNIVVETPDWCPLKEHKEVTIKLIE